MAAIHLYTAQQWSEGQADDYAAFLDAVILRLADDPTVAPTVPGEKELRCYVARWDNARQGHRNFFEAVTGGINVLRILHTAMHWPDILSGQAGETAAD